MNSALTKWLIVGLLLSNIALVAFLLMGRHRAHRPMPDRGRGMHKELVDQLGFSSDQADSLASLVKVHRKRIHTAMDEVADRRAELLKRSGPPIEPALADSLLQQISEAQLRVDRQHLQHLQEVYALCTPEQQANFAGFRERLEQRIRKPRSHRGKRGKRGEKGGRRIE